MLKAVYVVVRLNVEAGSWREGKSTQEVAAECDYRFSIGEDTGYKIVETAIIAASDECPEV